MYQGTRGGNVSRLRYIGITSSPDATDGDTICRCDRNIDMPSLCRLRTVRRVPGDTPMSFSSLSADVLTRRWSAKTLAAVGVEPRLCTTGSPQAHSSAAPASHVYIRKPGAERQMRKPGEEARASGHHGKYFVSHCKGGQRAVRALGLTAHPAAECGSTTHDARHNQSQLVLEGATVPSSITLRGSQRHPCVMYCQHTG